MSKNITEKRYGARFYIEVLEAFHDLPADWRDYSSSTSEEEALHWAERASKTYRKVRVRKEQTVITSEILRTFE